MLGLVEGWAPRIGETTAGGDSELELGNHLVSKELAALNINKKARSGVYAEDMMTKLHYPDIRWNADTLEKIVVEI